MSARFTFTYALAAAVAVVLSPLASAAYDAGSTSSSILDSCKDFSLKTGGTYGPQLQHTCNTCNSEGTMGTVSTAPYINVRIGINSSGQLDGCTNGTCYDGDDPDPAQLCTAFSLSSTTTAVTFGARCSKADTLSPSCDTDANGNYDSAACPASTINLADHFDNPSVNNHLAACADGS